jgi:hypothetical protein
MAVCFSKPRAILFQKLLLDGDSRFLPLKSGKTATISLALAKHEC